MLSITIHITEQDLDKWIGELGCTNAPVQRRNISTALRFFARRMPRLPLNDAVGFLGAMDLSRSVHEVMLTAGERLLGFRLGGESPFKLFFARRGASSHSSGINTAGRTAVHFVVEKPVLALESFTSAAKDSWTPRTADQRGSVAPRSKKWFQVDSGVIAMGGGRQLIVPDSSSHLLVEKA